MAKGKGTQGKYNYGNGPNYNGLFSRSAYSEKKCHDSVVRSEKAL